MNLYGSKVASGTLTTACLFAPTVGGTEGSNTTTYSGSASVPYAEVWSQGNSNYTSYQSTIPAPTGHGWVYSPGAGTFAAGNWSASLAIALYCATNSNLTMRFYKRSSGGTYTSIGNLSAPLAQSGSLTTRQTATFNAVSFVSMAFLATDLLYTDLWVYDPTYPGGDSPTLYMSTSSSNGVSGDMAVITSSFSTGTTRNLIRHKAFGRLR